MRQLRVLVADDALFMRMLLKKMLTELDCNVIAEASDGQEAYELTLAHMPDVVTMDITMPNLNGIEAVKAIKKELPGTEIIMCSAMGQQDMVMDALQSGAYDFLVKPFEKSRVAKTIRELKKKLL